MKSVLRGLVGVMLVGSGASVLAAQARPQLAAITCAALDQAVTSQAAGPVLVASYPALDGQPAPILALRGVAFTYDNALASIALFACGKVESARRIADALAFATHHDPEYQDGRLRNAYAAGSVGVPTMKLPGYWSTERNAWNQDAYQVSSATGNQAWAALALLEAFRQSGEASYLEAARKVLHWSQQNTYDGRSPAGFSGGYYGYFSKQVQQNWKSTEHNVDLAAAWSALDAVEPDQGAAQQARIARQFVASQWDAAEGRFLIGTGADGQTSDRVRSGLDAQIWPLIALQHPPKDWRRVFAFIDRTHRAGEGYGFNRDPDGLWTEGTAQAAAVAQLSGLGDKAQPLWSVLLAQEAGHGWLFATPAPRISTGLAIGPDSVTNDFFYYHLPHLGATAWAAIAATGVNPFTGSLEAD
ncbi:MULTISPECIES: hypothetical protein [unclassified Pseudomonas]|uniref:hypothetical protein n=1 Tax=unclassified Pseudomonas TaxID=196821 RepID=UPI002AC9DFE3|nr:MULTISPECIES: hypothetical protein [unclassified Pseudomonas]MEB0047856.1 hypothetical protein [Pseudomonas sp. Dout3]MEB0098370.1 hypothetical protein [Pseudomonas sp. DC1.2]WPX57155.1 hypothetical protein RHM68_16105 [Pseudomonas sp. DC1.2]